MYLYGQLVFELMNLIESFQHFCKLFCKCMSRSNANRFLHEKCLILIIIHIRKLNLYSVSLKYLLKFKITFFK